MDANRKRVSEMQNDITETIDAASPAEMLEMLETTEKQIFDGWKGYPHIFSTQHMQTVVSLASKAANMLHDNIHNKANNAFVFGGCGTSGRTAWLCCRTFNHLLKQRKIEPCFKYVVSGGDETLIVCRETAEDDPVAGVRDLTVMTKNNQSVLVSTYSNGLLLSQEAPKVNMALVVIQYFGITCGFSAPYVAGQIDYAMTQEKMTPVLVGYNPVSLARNAPIEKWPEKTCRQVFSQLEKEEKKNRGFVLNPIIGPEPVTGSTRMKGGTTTKVLLETIFLAALNQSLNESGKHIDECTPKRCRNSEISESIIRNILGFYQQAITAGYRSAHLSLADLMSKAGDCLRKPDSHLYYIGVDAFGLISLIDGAEMLDTFGSSVDDVRGFVEGGWTTCDTISGDISKLGHVYKISTEHFESDILPVLTANDMVILVGPEVTSTQLLQRLTLCPAQLAKITIAANGRAPTSQILTSRYCAEAVLTPSKWTDFNTADSFLLVEEIDQLGKEVMVKVALCAVSTAANILIGRVYSNIMINLAVANDKLFYRSVEIISQLSNSSVAVSRSSLLHAIYGSETLTNEIEMKPVSEHVLAALKVKMVVPTAIVLASGKASTVCEAKRMIQAAKSIRLLLKP